MDDHANLAPTRDLQESAEDSSGSCSPLHYAKIGRYTVLRRIGLGGFGQVLLARDEDLDRLVAIKVPRSERVSRPEDVQAFLNEARIVASLDHPHIVPVYDVGRTEEGLCFVVSKFMEGSDLATRIETGCMSFHESAEMVATVANALHHAHTRGLVHRDIKPGNILIDAAAKSYIADFGLALKDEDFGKGGGLAGTPAYMSPEQARGAGHLVDGRSDIFSLGVVFYELLTGRRPFRADSLPEIIEQVTHAEARPPRQIDDSIPKELERICLKAMAKRASERYTTARDMAEDLRMFLQATGAGDSPPPAPVPIAQAGSRLEAAPLAATWQQSDSNRRPIKIVPKGLRSFDEHDADFFLELLPGPRDRDGLPESIRFWKTRIEETDADKSFRVGLLYGPSGSGKSSLVRAGLLPRLEKHILPVYIEATAEETEARLLRVLRKRCPELSRGWGLVDSLANVRRGRILPPDRKVLLIVDQFEQWLHAKRGEENTELIAALRHCDGEHIQAIVTVRDDFWMAATRFMRGLEIRLLEGENSAAVDLFDLLHSKRVLTAFGVAYGVLPESASDFSPKQQEFVDQSVAGLAQDGKIIQVRLALFAEMMKGKPWTSATLQEVGGTQGVGLAFLEETFSASTTPPEHRFHQQAAQAVLKALLPESGTDIKGEMRSREELLETSGYANRPRDFDDLIRILDPELRLITPTDPEGPLNEGETTANQILAVRSANERPFAERKATLPSRQYYQLSHDYLVHSLRGWLTRKQRETRRGRAELRLAELASLWNAKPETRHLPSAVEWANIRLLTRKKDWTNPERRMMRRAGRVHGLRTLGALVLACLIFWAGLDGYGRLRAAALVESLQKVGTPDVPAIVRQLSGYRRWADPQLVLVLKSTDQKTREHLHASLALLPVDATLADYVFNRLLTAPPSELAVLCDALKPYSSTLAPKLWTVLESVKPGDARLLPAAGALATYDPDDARWEAAGDKVASALVSVNSLLLRPWIEALRPVRAKLTAPIATIFQDKSRSETVHSLATDILTDYASDNPAQLAELLLVSDHTAYRSLFPLAEKKAGQVLPVFRAELARKAVYSWNDPLLDSSWTKPDSSIISRIESAQGIFAERFAFCQTMSLDEFLSTAAALGKSGYRPVRFRPHAEGKILQVAALWARDARRWRISSRLTADEVRQQDGRNHKDRFLPVDVAGYLATQAEGKAGERYAALWVEGSPDENARMYVGVTADEAALVQDKLKDENLVPRTLHTMIGADERPKYCGVWARPPAALTTGQSFQDQFEGAFGKKQADLGDQLLIDVAVSAAPKKQAPAERAQAALASANKTLETKPDDADARMSRAMAYFRLGENQKAVDDLQVVIGKNPESVRAKQYKVVALARLRKKQIAQSEMQRFRKDEAPESSKLYLAAVVAAEIGEGLSTALAALEEALKTRPTDAELRYAAARALSLASKAISRSDKAKGRQLADRSLQLLRQAVKNDDADFGDMDEDGDLDPIRDDLAFAEIMKAGKPDRRYASVWSGDASFVAISLCGLGPVAHVSEARELIAQGYRPVSVSVARAARSGPLVAASVWHRPTVREELKDRLAERQARSAIALLRMGKAEEVWAILRHSPDPRLRSFILNSLNPLAVDPKLIAGQLARLDPSRRPAHRKEGGPSTSLGVGRRPGEGSAAPEYEQMEAILFHPETSIRRALILALGTYGPEGLSGGEREPLAAKLLEIYRNDPDAGIHGAAEWTLRKWGDDKLTRAADGELMRLNDCAGRRWFVNGQGQTFAVIDGPVEFQMGSPPTDTQRIAGDEPPRRVRIPRRFAIAAKEVTVAQFQRFLKLAGITTDRYQVPASLLSRYSSDPEGPWIDPGWYVAAHYCNWLTEQEGIPKDQWCYITNEARAYAEGMSIPGDVLERTGYRLPTEAEWEYACRAGSVTSRYYGHSMALLDAYARYQNNGMEHAWRCGSLFPNDLGLFDMLGNVYEWCQDTSNTSLSGKKMPIDDGVSHAEHMGEKNVRVLRGGTFFFLPALVRSAVRIKVAPSYRSSTGGFRLARTCR